MSAVLLARVRAFGGTEAVDEVLRLAASPRTREYLADTTNWIAYDEAVALWQAGARVTHHPQFARSVGEDAARRLGGSQVAAMLRSLGSPEAVYRQLATSASKFSTATKFETIDAGPGYAELVSTAVEGFPRSPEHCAWTCGLLSCATELFGLPPAAVRHDECAAMGAEHCVYRVRWSPPAAAADEPANVGSHEQVTALRQQLDAMKERVDSMFATAADLIAADDLDDVLARITRRAALEVRAIRYLLAVRLHPGGDLHCHHKGFEEEGVAEYVDRLFAADPSIQPDSWLVVPVRSNRRDYGRLLAICAPSQRFLAQERELFEVYARYAASALDGAAALLEAKERGDHASALLSLARALAAAGTSDEIARRLADAVPLVVDCDRVGVYLWDAGSGELVRRAVTTRDEQSGAEVEAKAWVPSAGGPLARLLTHPNEKFLLVDEHRGHPRLRELFATEGFVATVLVPLVGGESFLGLLSVSVCEGATRLRLTADLRDRLSGVAAQATTALQNGRLVDEITHQALHDQLTGLANRLQFTGLLRTAIERAREEVRPVTLLYMDLDGFKPVNDEFGHDVGDQLLVAVAKRLVACVREGDTVARLGGDEFAVLIGSETAPSDAETVSDRLAAALTDPFVIEGHELYLGTSIGRAVFPIDAEHPDGLLRSADAAMFRVKRGAHPHPHPPTGALARGR
ncbi:MAG TPA: diguanylate cyclase [Solirubrobacteraceae bacterium]|nr:diguanylate cyclase [Solirubrobacteraceae bacterium]